MKRKALCLKTNQFHRRGKLYEIFNFDGERTNEGVFIVDEFNRKRKVDEGDFDFVNTKVVNCVSWKFDDLPEEIDEHFFSWLEITLFMSNNTKRWCKLYTPSLLEKILSRDNISPPGFGLEGCIAIRSFAKEDIQEMINYLQEENELEKYSLPY